MATITLNDLPETLRKKLTRRVLIPGEILLQQGDAAKYLYWVVSGQLQLVSFINQQMITHYFVKAGEFLGESALHIDTYGCTAIAETPSEVLRIPVNDFATELERCPTLCKQYLENLTYRFYNVKALLELRSINPARDRLLHYLMQRRSPEQLMVQVDKPFRVVASELAITPEALSRLLSQLQRELLSNLVYEEELSSVLVSS